MTITRPTNTPTSVELIEDNVPLGWCFARQSWAVHRAFYRQTGRTMEFREYSYLLRYRGTTAECLDKRRNVWRLTALRGESVVLQRTGRVIRQILPPDWSPAPSGESIAAAPVQSPMPKPEPQPKLEPQQPQSVQPEQPPAPVQPAPPGKPTTHDLRARLGLPPR
jgi:hypothetical protein